jgi:hypothetical protein
VGTGTPRRDHDHAHTQPAPAPAPITNGNAANITNKAVAQHTCVSQDFRTRTLRRVLDQTVQAALARRAT